MSADLSDPQILPAYSAIVRNDPTNWHVVHMSYTPHTYSYHYRLTLVLVIFSRLLLTYGQVIIPPSPIYYLPLTIDIDDQPPDHVPHQTRDKLSLLATGTGGIEELATRLIDDDVYFAFIREDRAFAIISYFPAGIPGVRRGELSGLDPTFGT
jgi:hypothetical protein